MSATTGDRYPARAIFQIFIALTSGPRFALVFLWFWLTTRSTLTSSKGFGNFLLGVGLVRTVACGGWVYITSSDDHLTHDIAMVLYLLCTLPWQLGVLATSDKKNPAAVRWRKFFTFAFFTTLPPMIYYFVQHKVKRVPGGKCLDERCYVELKARNGHPGHANPFASIYNLRVLRVVINSL